MEYWLMYIVIINVVTYHVYGFDKRRAKKKQRRVPEKVLLGLTLAGGSVGALVGMKVYRHKIKKWKFFVGVPLIFVMHVIIIICVSFVC